ncbi:putative sugar phosphate/phosphate translocator [Citrus sinensis]|uniref:Sugar phosphate/phosphate translocator n=1 Tax=Citrus sinensis TaxID=2711 RepID=A0ACB8M1F0_CITSI|nr:putative sugar phosphate/phosphate translocator [Citrus sinensis]
MKVEDGMTLEIYTTSVIPIGAMFAMTLWLGNTAYLYISVAFAQMLKAIMPVAVFILGVAAGLEKPKMDALETWHFPPLMLTLNCLCTFALNLSVFLVISHTSALTIRVAGVVKDWVVVLFSALLFADTKLTIINLFGYGIAIAGVAAYNNHKLKKEASRAISDDSQQTQLTATTTSSTSEI